MKRCLPAAMFLLLLPAALLSAQGGRIQPRVEIPWNRYYTHEELLGLMDRLKEAWPGFVRFEDIGRTYEGRVLRVLVLTNQETGGDRDKVAMWVDGNVHGNEVQGAEAALYLAWWLLEHQESNERARTLLDRRVFYILPSQNPDGRDYWFEEPNTASSSRSGKKPFDNDRDGLLDEDGPDDLDGDGEILMMRKQVPPGTGNFRLDPDDARILVPADKDHPGDWILLGQEGIDNDGDGRVNEDGPGGYDMNRNWPSDWQPWHVQYGAGDYPFSYPEPRAIGRFLLDHPNIAAVQSFHNAGGMLLRGPGAETIRYPRADVRVYDEIGKEGEQILPFYRYMIIWKDLYSVHGGFVNWAYEGLGVFAFSNELWSSSQYFGGRREQGRQGFFGSGRKNGLDFNDSVLLGDAWVAWHPVDHPLYGQVEVGGFKREHGRVAPSFMIEEMLHRNAMFCARHAEGIADLEAEPLEIEDLGGGLWRVAWTVRNKTLLPTRSAMAAREKIGIPDRATLKGGDVEVLTGGISSDRFRPNRIELQDGDPGRILVEEGVPSRGWVKVVWFVRGRGGFELRYQAEKADDLTVAAALPE